MIYRFDAFSLDTESLELRDGDDPVAVEPGVFSILAYLIDNRDRVVSKDELIEAIWDGRAISDGALNSRINAARRAVGDSGSSQSVIKTFARRGFRFVAQVTEEAQRDQPVQPSQIFDKPSIAVLPFTKLSDDPEQEYFSDGISEDLITALSRIRQFMVVARNSSFSYKGRSPDVRRVAEELGVRYVVEGSVRKSGERIRVSAQLIDGKTGNQIWGERFDRRLEDIFDLQDELTQMLAGAIEPELSRAEQQVVASKPPEEFSAWDAYQRGMWHAHKMRPDDNVEAKKLFHQAILLDPKFAASYHGLATVLHTEGWYARSTDKTNSYEATLAAAQTALSLDSGDANTQLALARAYQLGRNQKRVIAECREAIRLNPSLAGAYHMLGRGLIHTGEAAASIEYFDTAIRLSPNDPFVFMFFAGRAMAHLYLRQHDEAVAWAERAVSQPNAFWPVHAVMAAALSHLDRETEAKDAIAALLLNRPGASQSFVQENVPTESKEYLEHLLNGLRKAGLPE